MLLNMPMKTPSMAAYRNTIGGEITRRNETSSTTPKPTRPERISAGMYSDGGTNIHASAAEMTSTPITTAVLVMTSSNVIRGSVLTGGWP